MHFLIELGVLHSTSKKLIAFVKEAEESDNSDKKAKIRGLILEAIVACKHAMRTFPKIKVDKD